MNEQDDCACRAAPRLIFACSGAADVGAIADQAARKLSQEGAGRMFCLAGVGGCVEPILATTEAASRILVIDGCPLDCGRHCVEQASFVQFAHLRVTDLGMARGRSPITEERVAQVAAKGAEMLAS